MPAYALPTTNGNLSFGRSTVNSGVGVPLKSYFECLLEKSLV